MLGGLVCPETMCLNSKDMSVLERFKWLQQQVVSHNNSNSHGLLHVLQFHGSNGRELKRAETYLGNHDELQSSSRFPMVGSDFRLNSNMGFAPPNDTMDGCISRTNSIQMKPLDTTAAILKNPEEHKGVALNKRKSKFNVVKESGGKKIKGDAERESSIKEKSNFSDTEASSDASKETLKPSEIQKPDYIHVRARRGQATDRHSLAERARREKISKKMKYLQDLVPGCDKITGKAGMLDEIINYVQSLQREVEFLSLKLTVLNPALEFHIDDLSAEKQFQNYMENLPMTSSKPSEMTNLHPFQINQEGSLDQTASKHNTTSLHWKTQPSSRWEPHSHSLYNASSHVFQY